MYRYKLYVNGRFLEGNITGQGRFACEILTELDKIIAKGKLAIVVPPKAKKCLSLKNIEVIKHGRLKGRAWEQISFALFLILNKAKPLNLCTIFPIVRTGPTCVHDISYKLNKRYFIGIKGTISRWWNCLMYKRLFSSKEKIITVTEYSKKQIVDTYGVVPDRITIISNSWQHFKEIQCDNKILESDTRIKKGNFYFALGSLAKNKNFDWIFNVALNNADDCFVIAGEEVEFYKNAIVKKPNNVIYLGYVSDQAVRSLYRNCKAFLFPSIYEGFGIPPIEALSVGCPVIAAKASSLPEILEDSVHYIDPYDPNVDLGQLLTQGVEAADKVLGKYSWSKSAEKLLIFLTDIIGGDIYAQK